MFLFFVYIFNFFFAAFNLFNVSLGLTITVNVILIYGIMKVKVNNSIDTHIFMYFFLEKHISFKAMVFVKILYKHVAFHKCVVLFSIDSSCNFLFQRLENGRTLFIVLHSLFFFTWWVYLKKMSVFLIHVFFLFSYKFNALVVFIPSKITL